MIGSSFPWWLKIVVKSGLSIVPLPYYKLRGLAGKQGSMVQEDYAQSIFEKFIKEYREFNKGGFKGNLLELGPGGSLLNGLYARKAGFDKCYFVDVVDYASQEMSIYKKLIMELDEEDQNSFNIAFAESGDLNEAFRQIGIIYLTNGLESLRGIPSDSISYSFSNAVLEHVRIGEFAQTVAELKRTHRPDSISSHQVDYKDHLASSLNSLRFSQKLWESRYFPNSGFYTNRLRNRDVIDFFVDGGFSVEENRPEFWEKPPLEKTKLAREFQDYDENELLIQSGYIVFRA
jgi:hypothetical protein